MRAAAADEYTPAPAGSTPTVRIRTLADLDRFRGHGDQGPQLDAADLTSANLVGARLSMANLVGARLDRAKLARAWLDGANLTEASLDEADLTEARLDGANLTRTILRKANLTNADLAEAVLTYVNLAGADLTGASLLDADVTRANFTGATLLGTDLSSVRGLDIDRVEGARWSHETRWPPAIRALVTERSILLDDGTHQVDIGGGRESADLPGVPV